MSKVVSLRGDALPPDDPPAESVPDFLRRMAESVEAGAAIGAVLILDAGDEMSVAVSDAVAEKPINHMLGILEFAKIMAAEMEYE